MWASVKDRERWIKQARKERATRILVVCDTFDYEQYPVYCRDEKEMGEKRGEYDGKNMQRVEDVIVVPKGGRLSKLGIRKAAVGTARHFG
jgi:hypothetical protein